MSLNTKGQDKRYTLKLESKSQISKSILNSYNSYKGDSSQIIIKLQNLIQDLQSNGYLSASIDTFSFDSMFVYAEIFQGKQFKWGSIEFKNIENELKRELGLQNKFNKNPIINLNNIQDIKNQLVTYYENSGYPFVNVFYDSIDIKDSIFYASVSVEKGDYYSIDSIIVKGSAKISSNYISKTIQLSSKDQFNQKKINAITKAFNDISFLSEIKPSEIEFKQKTVDLYLYLQNEKANMFNGIIGFLPDDKGNLLITGDLALNLKNSFGRGEEVFLNWEKLESSSQKLNLGFNYPYIFKSNFGIDTDFELYKKDSTYLSLKAGLGLRLFLSNDDYLKAYYRYKSSNRIGNESHTIVTSNFANVKSNILGVSYVLSNVDYKYNPRKGINIELFGGAGIKKLTDSKSRIDSINSDLDKSTLELEAGLNLELFYPIYNNFVFHFENETRYLDQFTDKGKESYLFENELYKFGGAYSLRGFDESVFLASIYSIQNIEIRYLFEQNSAFYAFWNGAYYYQNISETVIEDFPWGIGIGLDFDTKAGIFSLSYAIGKQFDNPFEIQTAKIHFGYISRF